MVSAGSGKMNDMPCYEHVLVIVPFLIQYRHMLLVCFLSFPVIFALSQNGETRRLHCEMDIYSGHSLELS